MKQIRIKTSFTAGCLAMTGLIILLAARSETETKTADKPKPCKCMLDKVTGDTLKVFFESRGCFHWYQETTLIYRKHNHWVAEWKVTSGEPGRRSVVLNDALIGYYVDFEKWVGAYKSKDICTTVDSYTIIAGSDTLRLTDGSCSDENMAYRNMISRFFPERK